jgi:fructosamine-3-kinase
VPLPPLLKESLEDSLGGSITTAESVGGGMMNHAARIYLNGEWVFVKWNITAPSGLYAAEAAGLNALRATHTLHIPQVLAYRDKEDVDIPYLVLEWLEPAKNRNDEDFSRAFATQLVALHATTTGTAFGWTEDNFLGIYPQSNGYRETWPEFYHQNRLMPHLELARRLGHLPPQRQALLHKVCDNLEHILDGMEPHPSLIHGDLWSGNFIHASQGVALLDPAVYHAPREVELAFIELFDGFPPRFVEHYRQISPLPDGY